MSNGKTEKERRGRGKGEGKRGNKRKGKKRKGWKKKNELQYENKIQRSEGKDIGEIEKLRQADIDSRDGEGQVGGNTF